MNVFLNSVTGIDDAMVSMYMSKRSWTREKEIEIRHVCSAIFDPILGFKTKQEEKNYTKFCNLLDKLVAIGVHHNTLLRFIDFSITVEGLHRAGQDDWDSHAKRFENRIVRSSTRLSSFSCEMSDYYRDKIIPTDLALAYAGVVTPEEIVKDGVAYVKGVNGYIRKGLENCPDVKRGLYMLSIPSNFIFKINLTEWCHVYKERNKNGSANPEVKELCEVIADQIEDITAGFFDRKLFLDVKN